MSKRIYPSRYSNGNLVTAAQYITELICEKKAKLDKSDLPQKFWEQTKWQKFFRQQIVSANQLVSKYNPKAIIRALNHFSTSNVYSLRAPQLLNIIIVEQSKLKEKKEVEISRTSTLSKPRPNTNKTILSKLKELDGEEESTRG